MLQRRLSLVLQASSQSSSSSVSHVPMGRRSSLPLLMTTNSNGSNTLVLNGSQASDGQQLLSRQFSTNPRWTNKDECSPRIVETISSTVTVSESRVRSRRRRSSLSEHDYDEEEDNNYERYSDRYNRNGFFVVSDSSTAMRSQRDSSLMLEQLRRQQVETSVFDQYSSQMMDEWRGYVHEPDEPKSQNRCDL